MKLDELIFRNKNLVFRDAKTGVDKGIDKISNSLEIGYHEDVRGLIFVYNDNQLGAMEVLLNFYQSNDAIALLNIGLFEGYKIELERKYKPLYIFDPSRTEINGYMPVRVSEDITLFKRSDDFRYPINQNIKILMNTSGTTGSPKFVKLSDDNLVENAISILDYMPIQKEDVVPINVPVNFVYGLSIFTTNCIKASTIVCTSKDVFQKGFWDDFANYKYSTLGGVPYFYEILQRIGFFKKDSPSLRYLTHTGGLLNQNLWNTIAEYSKKFQKQFVVQYGQTEAGGRMAALLSDDFYHKRGTIGKPIKGGMFRLHEDTGELIYSGANVFGGYANSINDLEFFKQAEELYTGDIARVDKDGYYYIEGRMKRIVKLLGVRLNLDEVELILKNSLEGSIFICVGIEDKYMVIVYSDDKWDRQSIGGVLREKLGINPNYYKTKFLKEIPLTVNGKVDYPLLTKEIHSGEIRL
ncbi:AMP-binding protein [Flavivirga sp. 57AJ16]|uniref:AMP-binding protein n=1 Tax=Flavivirga sp. 57AJ16 TaxID=3025307 RepID=UPI002366A023|nr:AMP-binding protein [Flavivirga sp. 57AJ16]MDD7887576.1 AMP-binding protein [Flavivirga sp. 57AJ16]